MGFLDKNGLEYFIKNIIGDRDISKIGDGTIKGSIFATNNKINKEFMTDTEFTTLWNEIKA